MKRVVVAVLALLLIGFIAPKASADTLVLQEVLFVVNGTQYYNTFAVPGLNTVSYNTTTGEGTLIETFNPGAPGAYSFDSYFDNELNVPFFNEYGTVNGSPAAGQTYQIDDPLFGTIFGNTQTDTLDNTNHIPGTTDNYNGGCNSVYDPGCANSNDDVSMAMGFDFVLPAGDQAVITLNFSQTQPDGGFYLGQIHPQDPNNPSPIQLFFSGNVVIEPSGPPPPVPEPGSLVLLGTVTAVVFGAFRRKFSRN